MKSRHGLLAAGLLALACANPAAAQFANKPALIYSTGGKADKSLNEAAAKGAQRFMRAMNAQVTDFEPANEADFEVGQRAAAQNGFDPIVLVGFAQAAALAKVAKEFPNARFTIIDAKVDLSNVRSVLFKEQESTFLVGMAAALSSKSGKVGFIGGMDSPLMRRYQCGYEQGVRYANPKVEVIADMAGTTPAAWNDPAAGTRLALAQFGRGVDVVYTAAGTTGVSVIQAAKEKGKLAIGSTNKGADADTIITSTSKRVDNAVFQSFVSVLQGKWKAGEFMIGLAEAAIDWTPEDYNKKLISPEMKAKVDAAKADIIADKIKVHDYLATNSCKG
ncbi:MAG TPA: BMP family ABC transporter substrate-binding protein [Reyranella sp.]|jgi:basic membrane protein A|nr:BMP family ABC transporter substrate-binding protein [Reyranella sp.]